MGGKPLACNTSIVAFLGHVQVCGSHQLQCSCTVDVHNQVHVRQMPAWAIGYFLGVELAKGLVLFLFTFSIFSLDRLGV